MLVSVGPSTVNVTGLVVTPWLVTVTFLALAPAPAVIAKLAVTVVSVEVPVTVAVTPLPDTVTVVAPARPVPVRVTGTVAPLKPEAGLLEVSVGVSTVNKLAPVADPIGVVTTTFLGVSPAPVAIAQDAFTVVAVDVTPVHVMVGPPMATAVAPVRPVPVMVTGTVVPR